MGRKRKEQMKKVYERMFREEGLEFPLENQGGGYFINNGRLHLELPEYIGPGMSASIEIWGNVDSGNLGRAVKRNLAGFNPEMNFNF